MAFPSVAATNSGNSGANATSHTVNLPADIAIGDLLIVAFSVDGTPTITWPGTHTWTQLQLGSVHAAYRFEARYRRVTGDEGWGASGNTISIGTSASEGSAHVSYRITGHHASTNPNSAKTTPDPELGDNDPDPPNLDPADWATEDTLWIATYGWDGNVSHSAYPANYSSNQVTDRWANAAGVGVAIASREVAASSENPADGDLSTTAAWEAFTIAVRPTAAGVVIPVFLNQYRQRWN